MATRLIVVGAWGLHWGSNQPAVMLEELIVRVVLAGITAGCLTPVFVSNRAKLVFLRGLNGGSSQPEFHAALERFKGLAKRQAVISTVAFSLMAAWSLFPILLFAGLILWAFGEGNNKQIRKLAERLGLPGKGWWRASPPASQPQIAQRQSTPPPPRPTPPSVVPAVQHSHLPVPPSPVVPVGQQPATVAPGAGPAHPYGPSVKRRSALTITIVSLGAVVGVLLLIYGWILFGSGAEPKISGKPISHWVELLSDRNPNEQAKAAYELRWATADDLERYEDDIRQAALEGNRHASKVLALTFKDYAYLTWEEALPYVPESHEARVILLNQEPEQRSEILRSIRERIEEIDGAEFHYTEEERQTKIDAYQSVLRALGASDAGYPVESWDELRARLGREASADGSLE